MKVLFIVCKAVLGGHVISANTIAREMINFNVEPVFAGGDGQMVSEIAKYMEFIPIEIPLDHRGRQTYFTWSSFSASMEIRRIIRDKNIDLIHAFDSRAYMHAYVPAILEKKPILCTLCGGLDPYYNLPKTKYMMVFSQEQKEKLENKYGWKTADVEVIRTRLDVEKINSKDNSLSKEECHKYNIENMLKKVMLITRFDDTKIKGIHAILDAMKILEDRRVPFQFVIIGGGGTYYEETKEMVFALGREMSYVKIEFLGPIVNAYRILQNSDIVLGVGRSVFEGMAYGKPAIIIGDCGFSGVVSSENLDEIAYCNFSGRNKVDIEPPRVLADILEKLLNDEMLRKKLGIFGKAYIENEIDVKAGSGRILNKYVESLAGNSDGPEFSRWFSFIQCQLPVWRDNFQHSVKTSFKNLFS